MSDYTALPVVVSFTFRGLTRDSVESARGSLRHAFVLEDSVIDFRLGYVQRSGRGWSFGGSFEIEPASFVLPVYSEVGG